MELKDTTLSGGIVSHSYWITFLVGHIPRCQPDGNSPAKGFRILVGQLSPWNWNIEPPLPVAKPASFVANMLGQNNRNLNTLPLPQCRISPQASVHGLFHCRILRFLLLRQKHIPPAVAMFDSKNGDRPQKGRKTTLHQKFSGDLFIFLANFYDLGLESFSAAKYVQSTHFGYVQKQQITPTTRNSWFMLIHRIL